MRPRKRAQGRDLPSSGDGHSSMHCGASAPVFMPLSRVKARLKVRASKFGRAAKNY
jgi:hypothetical protein